MQLGNWGAQPPPAVVRCALAPNPNRPAITEGWGCHAFSAGREGAARCARGGRARALGSKRALEGESPSLAELPAGN